MVLRFFGCDIGDVPFDAGSGEVTSLAYVLQRLNETTGILVGEVAAKNSPSLDNLEKGTPDILQI